MLLLVCMNNLGIVYIVGSRGIIIVVDLVGNMMMKMLLVGILLFTLLMIDMRKPLKRDKLKQSVRENGRNFLVSPDEVVF